MTGIRPGADANDIRIVLRLLESVDRDAAQSQRRLAAELGIALGLVNAYLKRCAHKGLLKVRRVPARRYVYYLTPKGFAEKSRLAVEYLTSSLSFFRQAKADCIELFEGARQTGIKRVVLIGCTDLAEIAIICAIECGIEIVAVIDNETSVKSFARVPVVDSFGAVSGAFDAAVLTQVTGALDVWKLAHVHVGAESVLVPRFLRLVIRPIEVQ